MNTLQHLPVLILGLGDSGLAMARWCARHGADVTVADTREAPPQLAVLQAEWPQVRFRAGAFDAALVEGQPIRAVFKSPGLSPQAVAPVWDAARAAGLWLGTELTLFAHALRDLQDSHAYHPKVLAITGTNGKTTVTSLTGQLLERAGLRVAVAGNIGPTLLDTLARALDEAAQREAEHAAQQAEELAQVATVASADDAPAAAVVLANDVPDADAHDGGPALTMLPDSTHAGAAMSPDAAHTDADVMQQDAGATNEPDGPPDEAAAQSTPDAQAQDAHPQDTSDTAASPSLAEVLQEPPLIVPPPPPPPEHPWLPQAWVLELSSFQLDGVDDFEPTAATVLNLTQDHLDWHGDMAAYGAAKARIFGQQGLLVLNREDAAVMAMLPEPVRVRLQKPQYRTHVTFGGDLPQRPGDYGIETVNGMTWLVRAHEADETRKRRKDEDEEIHLQRLMPADALRIRGRHNALNALAALALAGSTGAPLAPMLYGLREYRGEPHRVEAVATIRDVEYFDDSKGTNVGATVAALQGLGAERRLVVILGGDGKGQDFTPLREPLQRHVRAAVLIGQDAQRLQDTLADSGVPLHHASTLEDAVQKCAALAKAGDAVLLSPACASMDMFRNYAHRAEVFVQAVQTLAQQWGEPA